METTTTITESGRIVRYNMDLFAYALFRECFTQATGNVEFVTKEYEYEDFNVDTTPVRSRNGIERFKVTYYSGRTVLKTENAILKDVFDIYFRFAAAYAEQVKKAAIEAQQHEATEFTYKLNLHKVIKEETREFRNLLAFVSTLENIAKGKGYDMTSIRPDGLITFKFSPKYGSKPTKAITDMLTEIFMNFNAEK